jgi:uncharacterized protein (TIGR02268 family)
MPLPLLPKWLAVTLLVTGATVKAQSRTVTNEDPGPREAPVPGAGLTRDVAELAALRARLAEVEAELATLRSRCAAYVDPAGLILGGWLDAKGVLTLSLEVKVLESDTSELTVLEGRGYHAGTWAAVALRVHNPPGRWPWAPGQVHLLRADGTPVKVRAGRMEKARLAAGEQEWLVLETEAPFWSAGEFFRLEITDESSTRVLSLDKVRL